jgi:hypothetical protein
MVCKEASPDIMAELMSSILPANDVPAPPEINYGDRAAMVPVVLMNFSSPLSYISTNDVLEFMRSLGLLPADIRITDILLRDYPLLSDGRQEYESYHNISVASKEVVSLGCTMQVQVSDDGTICSCYPAIKFDVSLGYFRASRTKHLELKPVSCHNEVSKSWWIENCLFTAVPKEFYER